MELQMAIAAVSPVPSLAARRPPPTPFIPSDSLSSSRRAFLLSLSCVGFGCSPFPRPTLPAFASSTDMDDMDDWFRYEGDGFSLSIPPDFEDIREPDDYVEGALYGNKAKPKSFAARFASPDRKEVLSVVIRQSSQLKLSFLAIKDVKELGSLREASNIFVPVGAKLYAATAITSSDEDPNRTYYYYEFATGDNYVALEAGASRGKVFVLGVTAPKSKWKEDSRRLRLAAKSFSIL